MQIVFLGLVFLSVFICIKYPYWSCINVLLSHRWADVFSAKGCNDGPEHLFSHPFVQVCSRVNALFRTYYYVGCQDHSM